MIFFAFQKSYSSYVFKINFCDTLETTKYKAIISTKNYWSNNVKNITEKAKKSFFDKHSGLDNNDDSLFSPYLFACDCIPNLILNFYKFFATFNRDTDISGNLGFKLVFVTSYALKKVAIKDISHSRISHFQSI